MTERVPYGVSAVGGTLTEPVNTYSGRVGHALRPAFPAQRRELTNNGRGKEFHTCVSYADCHADLPPSFQLCR